MASVPKRLGERHRVAATLFATGASPTEVAQRLGWSRFTISHLRRSPEFAAEVRAVQVQWQARVLERLVQRIVATRHQGPQHGGARMSHQ